MGVVALLGMFCIYLTLPLSVFEINRAANPVLIGLGTAIIVYSAHKSLNVSIVLLVCIAIPSIAIACGFASDESDESYDTGIPHVVYDDGDLYVLHSTKDRATGSVYYQYNKVAKTKFIECMSKSIGSYTMEVSLYYAEMIDFLGTEKVCEISNKSFAEFNNDLIPVLESTN